MRRTFEKLLALLLALLLGFSPLQASWASLATGQPAGVLQSMPGHGQGSHVTGQQAEHQHKPCCQTHPCCQGCSGRSHCSFAHCSSCLPALLARLSPPTPPVVASSYGIFDIGSPSQGHTVILRPPKA
ncbi:MAG: hypothetical protein PVI52_03545 [Chromatiales bacterium]|jgi:hypothetical protein